MNLGNIALELNQNAKAQTKTKSNTKNTTWIKKAIKPVLGLIFLISIVFMGFGSYAYAYRHKIYPGVKAAGIDLSGKTKDEAREIIKTEVQKWQNDKFYAQIDKTKFKTSLAGVGVTYDYEKLVDEAFAIGHSQNWVQNGRDVASLYREDQNMNPVYEFSKKKWTKFTGKLATKVEQTAQEPHLALTAGKVQVVLGAPGVNIQTSKLKEDILKKAKNPNTNKVVIPIAKSQIQVPENQEKTITTQAEKYTEPINFTYEGQTFTASKSEIFGWLVFSREDEDFHLSVSDSAISNFVGGLAYHVDAKATNREVNPSGKVLNEGSQGRVLNRSVAIAAVKRALNSGGSRQITLKASVVEPQTVTIYPYGSPGMFPGKYIEIVLSRQMLYAFNGKDLVNQGAISSGLASHPSPQGVFSIYSRSRSSLMAGPGYYLPNVQWVNRFSGSYSIHGTYWHSNFGHPMSHGCINATNAYAQWIYTWAPMGTPVVIHY